MDFNTLKVTKNVIKAIVVRVILMAHSLLCVWRTVDVLGNGIYWLLGLVNGLLILETAYTVYRRKGVESKWFSLCFLIYLLAALPPLWLLELDKLENYDEIVENTNISALQEEALSTISGVTIPIRLEPNTWISVLEQSLLFLLIIGRWFLPRGKLTRDQLSQLLFVYVSIASDCTELFVLFEEDQVRNHRVLTLVTLAIWSGSLLQFTISLTATNMGQKSRAVADLKGGKSREKKKEGILKRIFKTELWSLTVSILLMDGPFLALRLFCMFIFNILKYGILFFAFKNTLMICLGIYRMIVVCIHYNKAGYDEAESAGWGMVSVADDKKHSYKKQDSSTPFISEDEVHYIIKNEQ